MNMDDKLKQLGDRLERSVAAEVRGAARRPKAAPSRRRLPIVGIATAGLAAAGVATVLLVGSGSGSGATGSGPGAIKIVPAKGSSASVKETAYIIKRMKAHLASTAGEGTVMETYQYSSGDVQADGALTNLGDPSDDSWFFRAPNTAQYWSNLDTGAAVGQAGETGNVVNGKYYSFALTVDNANKTYSLTQGMKSDPYANDGDNTGPGGGYLTDESGPGQVAAALHSGQATEKGTTTVNGTPAIALEVTEPGDPADQSSYQQDWLYVDAQTDQPLRMVLDFTGTDQGRYQTGLYVSDWYPSTQANIAKAKDRTIPAGYTKVPDAQGNTGYSGNSGS